MKLSCITTDCCIVDPYGLGVVCSNHHFPISRSTDDSKRVEIGSILGYTLGEDLVVDIISKKGEQAFLAIDGYVISDEFVSTNFILTKEIPKNAREMEWNYLETQNIPFLVEWRFFLVSLLLLFIAIVFLIFYKNLNSE